MSFGLVGRDPWPMAPGDHWLCLTPAIIENTDASAEPSSILACPSNEQALQNGMGKSVSGFRLKFRSDYTIAIAI